MTEQQRWMLAGTVEPLPDHLDETLSEMRELGMSELADEVEERMTAVRYFMDSIPKHERTEATP
jgi:hypothetical protein